MQDLKKLVSDLDDKESTTILSSRFIKSSFEVIGHVWLHFINTSLEFGEFPEDLKTSIVTPIEKVINTNKFSEFRPINTLPSAEKLLERAVYQQLMQYFNDNDLFFNNQSGFRSKHSCESALQLSITEWKNNMDKGLFTVAVFLDLKRAFETINRDILLKKLYNYGIRGKVLAWLTDYLRDRKQITRINNELSSAKVIKYGIPQGSILGPLLFIIYINDIQDYHDCDYIHLFADDTLLSVSDKNLNLAIDKMNNSLKNISRYLKINKLKLNVSKTKGMIITTQYKYKNINSDQINLIVDNMKIEIVTEVKYLGFVVDNFLKFNSHFIYIQKKITKKLYFFSRVSQHLSINSKITVFKTIIQPHFEYCATIIYTFDLNKITALQKLQNRAMRIILKCTRHTPIQLMLTSLQWFSIKNRLEYLAMVFIYKMLQNLLPIYFNKYIVFNNQIHEYSTRYNRQLHIYRQNSSLNMKTLLFKGFVQFNKLPDIIKNSNTVQEFKHRLALFIKEKLL